MGCDHAKLPIYLIENSIADSAVATDIRQGPVENAVKNIKAFGLQDKIKANLCNGLEDFNGEDCDTVIIAGMGAEEIIGILQKAEWTKSKDHRLILQPMTLEHKLREYLYKNGYYITEEDIAVEGSKIYVIFAVQWCDSELKEENYNLFTSKLYDAENRVAYIEKLIKRYEKKQNGYKISKGEECRDIKKITDMLYEVLGDMKRNS